jgi:hypothetical protein
MCANAMWEIFSTVIDTTPISVLSATTGSRKHVRTRTVPTVRAAQIFRAGVIIPIVTTKRMSSRPAPPCAGTPDLGMAPGAK